MAVRMIPGTHSSLPRKHAGCSRYFRECRVKQYVSGRLYYFWKQLGSIVGCFESLVLERF